MQRRMTSGIRREITGIDGRGRGAGRAGATLLFATIVAGCSDARPAVTASEGTTRGGTPGGISTAVRAGPWSSPGTWGGRVPGAGTTVRIPAGVEVALDVSPPALGRVDVEGTLRFTNGERTFEATTILVGGALEVGTEQAPYEGRATIVLAGDTRSDPSHGMGDKVLGVHGSGRIDLHGTPRVAWVKLGETAEAGASRLRLSRAVDWRPGNRIVVTATGWDARESEEVTVAEVQGADVLLATPLRFRHFGRLQTVLGTTLDERAEVGLLTHNVHVTSRFGSDSLLGGHVMFTDDARVRVSDVEFSRLGQAGRLGRYPVHWHLMGDAAGTYVRRSSVHHGLQRGIIVHGTHRAAVEENVVFDVRGHGVYVEDGSEQGTVIRGNLAALARKVRREHIIEGSTREDRHDGRDARASNFWFATANAQVVGNVAAGSEHGFGFWYDLATGNGHHPRNGGNSFTMGEFRDNVAHSQSADPGTATDYHPLEAGTGLRFDGENFRGRFRAFTAWKNANAGVWFQCSQDVGEVVLAGNRVGAMNFCFHGRTATLRQAVIVSDTENRPPGTTTAREFFGARAQQANHRFHGTHQDRRNVPGSYPVVMPMVLEQPRVAGFP